VQEVLACTFNYGEYGCGGGFTPGVFFYAADKKGLYPESKYNYTAGTTNLTGPCKTVRNTS